MNIKASSGPPLAVLVAGLALVVGCSKNRADSPDMTQVSEDREVSREAKAQFDEAAAFYKEQAEQGWDESRCKSAADRFDEVADDFPELVEARFNAGQAYHECEIYDAAEDRYEAALDIAEHGPSLANLGKIYWERGDEERAREHWEKAVEVDQRSTAARNNLAWLLIREIRETGDRRTFNELEEEAAGHLSRVLAVENDNIRAYALYALLYLEGSEQNEARLDIAELLLDEGSKIRDDYPALHNARGLLQLERNNVSEALSSFQRAVSLDPTFVEARMNVGNIVLDFRKYEEAVKQFEAVLERDPENYDALVGLGIAQRGLKKFDEAEATYRKAIDVDSERSRAYFNLGVLYKDFYANQQEGDLGATQQAYKDARGFFRTYLSKNGVSQEGRKEAKANIGDCEEVIEQLDEVIQAQQG